MSNKITPVILILFLFVSCVNEPTKGNALPIKPVQATTTILQKTPTISQIPTRIMNPSPSPTPDYAWVFLFPNLSGAQESNLFELLGKGDCVLPCFMNITPGKTGLEESRENLRNIGGNAKLGVALEKGIRDYYQFSLYGQQTLTIDMAGGLTQRLHYSVYVFSEQEKFKDKWYRYSIREVMLKLGVPDEVFATVNDGLQYAIGLIYKEQGLVLSWDGSRRNKEDYPICPDFKTEEIRMISMTITDPNSGLGLFDERENFYNRAAWKPIEEKSQMDEQDFYNLIISNPDACFVLER